MMKTLSVLLFAVLVLISCRPVKDPIFNGIENVKVNSVGFGESSVTLDMSYTNPNDFKAQLKEAQGDAWMDSTYLGHFVVDSTVQIPANSSFIVPVKLSLDMKKILKHSMSSLLNQDVLIRIVGTGKAGRNGVYRKVNLNYEGKQNLAKIFRDL